MKAKSVLLGLPLLCLACGNPTTDDANDAAGTGDPYLAKEVVAVGMLSPDNRYETPEHYMTEEFIRSNFKLEESVELKESALEHGIEYQWGTNTVGFTFGRYRPFQTIYAAEHDFDERYQPELVAAMNKLPKKPYTGGGPASQGLANEWPILSGSTGVKKDTVAANDSASTVSGIPPIAAMPAAPAKTNGKFMTVQGVGDKAVWDPANHTLHVLYSNHIVNVQVKTNGNQATEQQRAAMIANVIIGDITE